MRAVDGAGRAWRRRAGPTSSWPAIGSARRGCSPTLAPPARRKRLGTSWRSWRPRRIVPSGVYRMRRADDVFEEHRPALSRLAYRMLRSLADADDVLQEAYLRWTREDRAAVKSPRAYLFAIVTRLCIDQRQAVEARKTNYIGPWLPEPVVEPGEADPGGRLEVAESVSMALLVVLESLSPVERAAYLLRRVFDYGYDEIAAILDRSEPACRQLVSRAEGRILERRPRFEADPGEAERLTG